MIYELETDCHDELGKRPLFGADSTGRWRIPEMAVDTALWNAHSAIAKTNANLPLWAAGRDPFGPVFNLRFDLRFDFSFQLVKLNVRCRL